MSQARVIALYLPQFHPTPNNNRWWGEGFTEWTNVGKARPLFRGHYQPKVPADLGYYDLRMEQIKEQQVELARQAGIEGFCYYHYWFDTHRLELELPLEQVLKSGKPDFPFMLCWANDSWSAKMWNVDGTVTKTCLVEQKYGNKEWQEAHFLYLLRAFKDRRYMTHDDKPMFMVYNPHYIPNMGEMIATWRQLAQQHGLPGLHLIAHTFYADTQGPEMLEIGFDAVNACRLSDPVADRSFVRKAVQKVLRSVFRRPLVLDYKRSFPKFLGKAELRNNVYPTLIPNWDHTPRSGKGGYVYTHSTPSLFELHAKQILSAVAHKPEQDQIVFLKSWNEWGEGNYMEPDLKYGKGYLETLARALKQTK